MLVHLLLLSSALAMRFAVLDFDDASTEPGYEALGAGLQSMLTTDLSVASGLEVVERARLEEVRAEISLGSSGAVDAATAAEFGRLAGATHLVAGSCAVVGPQMRIDARLFDVETGKVVLAEAVEGERDAFFELEKDLARALLGAVKVELAPRERAELSRIHTADWAAFSDFATGVHLFDEARYAEAVEALRRATERDDRFELAQLTLGDYERIIADMEVRADALEVTRAERERLEKLAEAAGEAEMLSKLVEIADRSGKEHRRARLAALYTLAVAYGNIGTNRGKLHRLRATEDRFAMARSADVFAQRYYAEARELWPSVPLIIEQDNFYVGLPEDPADFDSTFARAVERLWEYGADYPINRRNYLWGNVRYPGEMARLLHLDASEELDLREDLLHRAEQLQLQPYQRDDLQEMLWEAQRKGLRLDASTAILRNFAAGTDNEHAVRGFKDKIERNRDLASLLDEAHRDAPMREWLLLSSWSHGPTEKAAREHFLTADTSEEGHKLLQRFRKVDDDGYVIIGDQPVWVYQTPFWLSTGPRTDPLRAGALRYHRAKESADPAPFAIIGGVPRRDVRVDLVIDYQRAPDFHSREIAEGRPAVEVLLGAVDIDCRKQEDPVTGEDVLARPMRAMAVRLSGGVVELVRLTESKRGMWDRKDAFRTEVVGKGSYKDAREIEVAITAEGSAVTVEVNGKRSRFTGVEVPRGYPGLRWDGLGYAEVRGLEVR